MDVNPPVQIKYDPVKTYNNFQFNYPGAQSEAGKRGWWPNIADIAFTATQQEALGLFAGHVFVCQVAGTGFKGIDMNTGLIDSTWNHTFTGNVRCILGTRNYLYVGGSFTAVNGVSSIASRTVNGLCRFHASGDLDTTWNPYPAAAAGGDPVVLGLWENEINSTLLVSGSALVTLNGTARAYIGEVSISDAGNATAWDPDPNGTVYKALPDVENTRIYLAGAFTQLNSLARPYLARVNATDGTSDSTWVSTPDAEVHDILLDSASDYVYVVGNFSNIGGAARKRAANIKDNATASTWDPNLNGNCHRLFRRNDVIFLMGAFTIVGATGRNRIAALTAAGAGSLLAWNPNANGEIWSGFLQDKTIYVAGAFTQLQGVAKAYVGRVHYPIFTDANTRHIAKTGSDAAAGTAAAPYLTIQHALDNLAGAFTYALIQDSGTYREKLNITYSANEDGGLFAADGEAPTIECNQGAYAGTYGARTTGRTKFSAGAAATFYYVAKWGNDGTGTRGNPALPFLTIQAALSDASRIANDTIQIQDSAVYVEQLSAGAIAVTIQAKDGEVPVIKWNASAHVISSTASLNVYGIVISGARAGIAAWNLINISGTGLTVNIYDCSILHHSHAIEITNPGGICNVFNCYFSDQYSIAIYVINMSNGGVFNLHNSYFYRNASRLAAGSVTQADVFITAYASGDDDVDATITDCTFEDSMQASNISIYGLNTELGGVHLVKDCLFFSTLPDEDKYYSSGVHISGPCGTSSTIIGCRAIKLGGLAFGQYYDGSARAQYTEDCLAESCEIYSSMNASILYWAHHGYIKNCAAVDSGGIGIELDRRVAGGGIVAQALSVVNAGKSGLKSTDITIDGCIEKGGTGLNLISGPTNSILEQGISGSSGQGYKEADPRPISDASGYENVALSATSYAIGTSGIDGDHIGIRSYILTILVSDNEFTIDGLTFSGPRNMRSGVKCGAETNIEQCSFLGLGVQGINAQENVRIVNNYFAVNGIGLHIAEGPSLARNNIFASCGSAGLLIGGVANEIKNNTAYACEYGQFDAFRAGVNVMKNNIYSSNGILDYDGRGNQAYSCVPIIADGATVSSGSRRDPLFRDPFAGDLRLQAIAVGYLFDSPAKGLADNGGDAGAYDFVYGNEKLTWTLANFATSGWRNPSIMERTRIPIKLSQGVRHDGGFFSDAPAFMREFRLIWNANIDMPAAQVTAMISIYESVINELLLSLDGGIIWITVKVNREEIMVYREIEGLSYTSKDVPTPIAMLILREST